MPSRSAVRDCIHCGNKIFFDDTIAKGRPLEYTNEGAGFRLHICKEHSETPEKRNSESSAQNKIIADMRKEIDQLKEDNKKIKAKLGIS